MPHMEHTHRSTFSTRFFIIFLIILAFPYFSTGESETLLHSEIYEIDYRGPETHSSVPPPHHSHGKPHSKSSASAGKALGLTGATQAENKAKKVRG